jgi:purine-cytosine permease-like protein
VKWLYVLIGGVLTTAMAIRPLGSVRLLRRIALVAVLLSITYLFIQLSRAGLPSFTKGSWTDFWGSTDYLIAVAVSWVPLAADYTRHSRSERAAFGGAMVGYTVSQIACYALGLLAFATVVHLDSADPQHDMFAALIAVPVGWLAFGALIARELDSSFADVYSTVVSLQNLGPKVDRRIFALIVGAVTTGLALVLSIGDYQNFLLLLGSVFVPMFAVFAVRFFVGDGWRTWDTSATAPARWLLLVPWLLGFVVYQLLNPGYVGWWATWWIDLRADLHLTVQPWMSASVLSFLVAGLATLALRRRVPA